MKRKLKEEGDEVDQERSILARQPVVSSQEEGQLAIWDILHKTEKIGLTAAGRSVQQLVS